MLSGRTRVSTITLTTRWARIFDWHSDGWLISGTRCRPLSCARRLFGGAVIAELLLTTCWQVEKRYFISWGENGSSVPISLQPQILDARTLYRTPLVQYSNRREIHLEESQLSRVKPLRFVRLPLPSAQ